MPELSVYESGNITADLPATFNDLAERWADLTEDQRILALGRLWEAKKTVIGPNGERWGLTEKKFIKRTAAIIGEDREVLSAVFLRYKKSQPNPEPPPQQVKCKLGVDAPVVPLGDRVREGKPKKTNGKRGRPRKKPKEPKEVPKILPVPKEVVEKFTKPNTEQPPLTPEQIREINRKIQQKLGKIGVL